MTEDEQAFVDAWVEHQLAERAESAARQRTYELQTLSDMKLSVLSTARVRVIGHDKMLQTDEERKKLFDLIEEGNRRLPPK